MEILTAELRRLNRQRHQPLDTDTAAWSAAVLRAYDARLSMASQALGAEEHLAQLDGMDRELERIRVEAMLQDAGLNLRAEQTDASAPANTPEPATLPPPVEEPPATSASTDELAAPAASAARLIGTVVHILPVDQRERYAEEFAGELYDLAAQGRSRWRQLLFVMRLLDRAWVLRAELAPPKQAPN